MDIPELTVRHEPYPVTPEFRKDWKRIHEHAPGASVFSTLEWMEEGWKQFGAGNGTIRPVRFIDRSGNTTALAFHRETRSPRAWGTVTGWRTVDYNAQRIPPVVAVDIPGLTGALIALYRDVAGRVDVFDFYKLDAMDDQLKAVCDGLESQGIKAELKVFNEQPQLRLPDSWEEYYQSHSRIFWKTPRRMRNRLVEVCGSVTHARYRDAEDFQRKPLESLLEEMGSVFERSWQYESMKENPEVTPDSMKRFYFNTARSGMENGSLDINLLYAADRLIAFDYNLLRGSSVYMICGMYDAEFKVYSPGRMLFIDEIKDGHERGDRIYEFGGEFLGYKEEWTSHKALACHLKIRGKTMTARIRSLMEMV